AGKAGGAGGRVPGADRAGAGGRPRADPPRLALLRQRWQGGHLRPDPGLAQEYRLALRAASPPYTDRLRRQGLPVADHGLLDSFTVGLDEKPARYIRMLRALPAGMSEWAVHPGRGDPESRAIDPNGWPVRRTDLDFLV